MTIYGYARVSTDGRSLDAQATALKAVGAERVFSEAIRGEDRSCGPGQGAGCAERWGCAGGDEARSPGQINP
jgi:hypothetical protein